MLKILRPLLFPYWILCFVLTHMPFPKQVPAQNGLDKIYHFLAYALLNFLVLSNLNKQKKAKRDLFTMSLAIISVYGLLDEVTQPIFGRQFDLLDLGADILGGALGAIIFLKIFRDELPGQLK